MEKSWNTAFVSSDTKLIKCQFKIKELACFVSQQFFIANLFLQGVGL